MQATSAALLLPLLLPFLAAVLSAGLMAGGSSRLQPATGRRLAALLALLPAAAFVWLLAQAAPLAAGEALSWRFSWMPTLGLDFLLYLDALGLLFALLVSGIGALVILYTSAYMAAPWRFLTYLFLFMTAMMGLVMAGDVISLFIFWEGTSIVSFLLVAYKWEKAEARRGAFRALLITGGGGIALLGGLLLAASVAGSSELPVIVAAGDGLRASPLYLAMLLLLAIAAFTKSAQFPFHIWLPGAMSAPTPASAYLHSATMVKAGIYLLARLNPALGQTETWFWLLGSVGLLTMVGGAYLGLKQNDLKALLAYSTISQLGALVLLIAQDTDIAFKALVIGVVAHALYKSALFLVVGGVDKQAGTRDLRQLGGLRRTMPYSFAVASMAALSMAGLPPLLGFLAKETLLATAVHPSLPRVLAPLFSLAVVAAGALLLAQAGLLIAGTFLGERKTSAREGSYLLWLTPAGPALLSLGLGLLPEPEGLATFLGAAAAAAHGAPVKVSLALWAGLTVPLALSVVAVSGGSLLFWQRDRVRGWQQRIGAGLSLNRLYGAGLSVVDGGAGLATRLQQGRLRPYLLLILLSELALVLLFGGSLLPATISLNLALPSSAIDSRAVLRLLALAVTVLAALSSVFLRRDVSAILAFGIVGLGVAILMALEPAPDVALVQVVVDVLALVILVLTLTRLPLAQRRSAQATAFLQSRLGLLRDALVAGGMGLLVAGLSFAALSSRPRVSAATPYYQENASPLTGATDVVGAIIVDFRSLDTLIEITVFAIAGLGIFTVLRQAARSARDAGEALEPLPEPAITMPFLHGIGGGAPSSFIRVLAYLALPLALMIAASHMLFGHLRPGDGFTAGVIVGLAVAFWYVVFGFAEVKRRLGWLRPAPLIGAGLLLAIGVGVAGALLHGSFLAPLDLGKGLPLPPGVKLSNGFLFEVAIFLAVLGGTAYILNTLGHPEQAAGATVPSLATSEPGEPADSDAQLTEEGAPALTIDQAPVQRR